jgi:hypothetical protein
MVGSCRSRTAVGHPTKVGQPKGGSNHEIIDRKNVQGNNGLAIFLGLSGFSARDLQQRLQHKHRY